jgi:hypothetical protein
MASVLVSFSTSIIARLPNETRVRTLQKVKIFEPFLSSESVGNIYLETAGS